MKMLAGAALLLLPALAGCGGDSKSGSPDSLEERQKTFVSGVRAADVFPASASDADILKQGEIICGNLRDGRTYEQESIRLDPNDRDDPATRVGREIVMEGSIRYLCPDQR